MKFSLIDRIVDLEPNARIVAIKNLSLAEEYLADHFPGFPVMPGVLMLEAMTQTGAWLIRVSEDFQHSVVVLREAKNVKYVNFVEPGQTLMLTCEIAEHGPRETKLKATGTVNGEQVVSARLVLERYNLSEEDPTQTMVDEAIRRNMRELLAVMYKPPVPA
ncbi:MAG: beta-hydroxyacyl-ACP dehydratase [Planctomycetaceae bacterium]|nr:beta-hydroxyacyl-ACP dehydratase [Planctomycetaceae bacterium]